MAALVAFVIVIGVAALRALIFQFLWNLMLIDFGAPEIGFWFAWGLLIMGSLLFNTIPPVTLKGNKE